MELLRDALSNEETKAAAMLLRFFVAIPLLVVREILPFTRPPTLALGNRD
jgi:hypothetical protein